MPNPSEDASLNQLVYVSSAVRPLNEAELHGILSVSRRNNNAVGITGLLLYWDGNFMQALEGPKAAVDQTHQRITRDARHMGMITLLRHDVAGRTFADWSMGFKTLSRDEAQASGFSDLILKRGTPLNGKEGDRALLLLQGFLARLR